MYHVAADSERLEERKSFEKRLEELQSSVTSRSSQGSRELDDVRRERDRLELTRSQLTDQVPCTLLFTLFSVYERMNRRSVHMFFG